MTMRFSLRLNNDLPVGQYIELAQRAETLGFDQFWVSNDLFLRSGGVVLTAVALKTYRIQVGSCVLNPYTMNAAEIAMLAATLDEASNGRFLLGISAGAAEFLGWIGLRHGKPLTATREAVVAIRQLLGNRSARCEGEFLSWGGEAYMRFPVERQVPIYIGAMGPQDAGDGRRGRRWSACPCSFPRSATTRRESRWTGDWHHETSQIRTLISPPASGSPRPGTVPPRAGFWRRKVAYYGSAMNETLLADLGLSRSDFEPVSRALVEERDEARAIDLVTDDMLRIGVVGEASEIIERLEPLVAAGATHLSFGPPLGPDFGEAINILGSVAQHFNR